MRKCCAHPPPPTPPPPHSLAVACVEISCTHCCFDTRPLCTCRMFLFLFQLIREWTRQCSSNTVQICANAILFAEMKIPVIQINTLVKRAQILQEKCCWHNPHFKFLVSAGFIQQILLKKRMKSSVCLLDAAFNYFPCEVVSLWLLFAEKAHYRINECM